jgi:zinc protease
MQQAEPDSGVAHFLEHMLFNGTTNYPDTTIDDVLRSFGLDFGADLNAYTTYDETVYQLSVPGTDAETVGTAFDVLREWASEATLDPAQVTAERGVVTEEARLYRGNPFAVVDAAFDQAYTAGTDYEGRDPLGSDASIAAMTTDELRPFYEAWYRPDLMAVVAVGDLPVDELEQQIVERFSDLEGPSDAPERRTAVVDPPASAHVETIVAPEQSTRFISIDFPLPAWDSNTYGGERLGVIEDLMGLMVQTRLTEASSTGANGLIDPFAGPFGFSRERAFFGFNADADDLAEGTSAILQEMHRRRATGFDDEEFARAVDTYRAGLESMLAAAPTTQDWEFAEQYVADYVEGADLSATRDRVQRLSGLLDALAPEDIANHLRWMMATSAPIVILVAPDAADLPSDADLAARVDRAEEEGLALAGVSAPEIATISELLAPPEPVEPVQQGSVPTVTGSVWWRFDNGVTAVFVPSDIAAGSVNLFAASAGGWSLLTTDEIARTTLATDAVADSGLGAISRASLDRFLSNSTASVEPYIDETHEGFVGSADAQDIEEMLQLLHLLVTEPRVDAVGLRSAKSAAKDRARALTTDPDAVLHAALLDALYGGDPKQSTPALSTGEIEGTTADELLGLYRARLGKVDDLVVVVVGDIDEGTVADLAATYLGTLPAGPSDTWLDVKPPVSASVQRTVDFGTSGSPAGLALVHSVETDVDTELQIAGNLLQEILDTRLNDSVREQFGASYGGSVWFDYAYEPDETASVSIFFEGDPDRITLIADTIDAEIAAIVAEGVNTVELASAKAVVGADRNYIGNDYYIDLVLSWAQTPTEDAATLDRVFDVLDSITIGDVDAVADELFGSGSRVEVLRVPTP